MKKLCAFSVILLFSVSLISCSVSEEHRGATTGAAIGAATGAAAGALMSKDGKRMGGAIIGGLAGALVGGVIGHYTYDVYRTRQETNQRYNYQSSNNSSVRIENTQAVPNYVRPGETVDLKAVYAVLSDRNDSEVQVTEVREITYQGDLVGKPEINVYRRGGTYSTTVPLILPQDARRGVYRVKTTIITSNSRDTRDTSFTVGN